MVQKHLIAVASSHTEVISLLPFLSFKVSTLLHVALLIFFFFLESFQLLTVWSQQKFDYIV